MKKVESDNWKLWMLVIVLLSLLVQFLVNLSFGQTIESFVYSTIPLLLFVLLYFWKIHKNIYVNPHAHKYMAAPKYQADINLSLGSDVIVPHYSAPIDLDPVEVGTLQDFRVDPRDITALIIDYAVRGNIEIVQKGKKNYELHMVKAIEFRSSHERTLFKALFPMFKSRSVVNFEALKRKISEFYDLINSEVFDDLVEKNILVDHPRSLKILTWKLFSLVNFLSLVISVIFSLPWELWIFNFFILVPTLLHSRKVRRTDYGKVILNKVYGLKEYIVTGEKDRMEFQEDNDLFYESLLPYAVALGVVDKWAKNIGDRMISVPTWFLTTQGMSQNISAFSSKMSDFASYAWEILEIANESSR